MNRETKNMIRVLNRLNKKDFMKIQVKEFPQSLIFFLITDYRGLKKLTKFYPDKYMSWSTKGIKHMQLNLTALIDEIPEVNIEEIYDYINIVQGSKLK